VKITAADDRDVDDNTVDYKLVPFRLGMHFEDMPLPEFNDIVFIRRRPQHETTIKDIAALAFAASRNYVESMRTMLFDTRIDPNSLDYDGRTALYVAVNNQQLEAIQLLLEAGADPFIVDSTGSTPVDRARELERDDIVEMLLAGSTGAPPAQLKETELRVVDMHEREASARTVKSAVATRKGFSERLDKELLDPDFRAPAPAAPVPLESQESDQFTVGGLVKTNWSVAASRAMTPGGRRLPQLSDDPDMPSPLLHAPSASIGRPASDGLAHHAFSPFDSHNGTPNNGSLHARTESVRPGEPKRVNFSDNTRPRINSLGPGARNLSTTHGLVDVIDSGEVSAAQVSARLHNNTPLPSGRIGLSRTAVPTLPVTPHLHTSPTTSPRSRGPASDRLGLMTSTRSKSSREHVRSRDHHNGDANGGSSLAVPKQPASLGRGASERGALTFARGARHQNGSQSARDDRSAPTMSGTVDTVADSPPVPLSGDEADSDEIEMAVIVHLPRPVHEVEGPRGRKGTAGKKGQMASLGEFEARTAQNSESDSESDSSNIDSGMFRESTTVGGHPVGVYDVDNSAGSDKPVKRVSMIGAKAVHGHRAGVAGEEQLGVSTVKRLHLTERRISTKTPKKKKKKDEVGAAAVAATTAVPSSGDESTARMSPSPTMGSTAATHVVSGDAATAATTSSLPSSSSTMVAGESPPAQRTRMVSVRSVTDLMGLEERVSTPARGSVPLPDDDDAVTVRRFPAVRTGGGNAAANVKPQTEVMSSAAAAAAVKAGSSATAVAPSVPATPAAAPTAESSIPPTPDPSFFKKLLGRAKTQDSGDDETGEPIVKAAATTTSAGAGAGAATAATAATAPATAVPSAVPATPPATTPAAKAANVAVALSAACEVPAAKGVSSVPVSPRTVSFADKPAVAVLTDTEESTTPIASTPTAAPVAAAAAAAATATSTAAGISKSPRRRKKKPQVVVTQSDADGGTTKTTKTTKTTHRDEDSAESDDHVHNMTRRNQAKLETLRRNHLVSMPGTVSDAESSHERRQSAGGKTESGDEARDDSRSGGGAASGGTSGGESDGGARRADGDNEREASEVGGVDPSAVPAQARLEQEKLGFFSRAVRRLQARNMVTNLEAAFIESYRGLVLLRNFGELNKQAVDKILKKHDKQLGTRFRESWQAQNCYQLTFCEQSMLGDLMREMELLYAQAYTRGHRTDAMNRLRVPDEGEHDVEVPAFQFGITLGLTLTMLAIAIYIFALMEEKPPFYTEMFIMYRGFFMAIMLVWFWGLNMYLWERYRVNYAFIFEFNPREHTKHITMWRAASIFSLVWALFLLIWALSVAKPPASRGSATCHRLRCRSPC
jgi:hypothetical protein